MACCANMLGLNISAGLKSVVSIYISIPLIIIPQLLLSGVVIKFERIGKGKQALVATPVVSDIMATRWAYEALMVKQFKDNKYGKLFFEAEKEISISSYLSYLEIPAIKTVLSEVGDGLAKNHTIDKKKMAIVRTNIHTIIQSGDLSDDDIKLYPGPAKADLESIKQTNEYLDYLAKKYEQRYRLATKRKEEIELYLGDEKLKLLKENYDNSKITEIVLNIYDYHGMVEYKNQYVRVSDPIYRLPLLNNGRAHFFSSVKKVGHNYLQTTWFNIMVIWFMTLGLYFILYFNGRNQRGN